MIKLELKDLISDSLIIIDFQKNNICQIRNNNIIKNESLNIDSQELISFINSYVTYFDNEYVDNSIMDGKIVELIIYTENETIKYEFKNKFPYNYNHFIDELKEKVDIYEL